MQFYRQRFLQYDSYYQKLHKEIEVYQCIRYSTRIGMITCLLVMSHIFNIAKKIQLENQQREDKIRQLQQALSDIQVCYDKTYNIPYLTYSHH